MTYAVHTTEAVVGRRREQEQLRAALVRAGSGQPGVVVASGEAGIGKTTLLEAFVAQAGATVLAGSCYPVAGEALPYAPVVQALRDLARRLSAERRDRLAAYWPSGLARLVPLSDQPAIPAGDPDEPLSLSGQGRLFESLLSLVAELARERPVVWVIEDLHWADRSTLDLISFLARNMRSEQVLLVLTVRTDALARDHPLRPWLAELNRLPSVERVTLERLDHDGTAEQLSALMRSRPDPDLVDLVHDHAAGNPLFTAEVLSWVSGPGGPVPETLRDLVEVRLGTLPSATRRVLEVASVLGRRVALDLVATVGEMTEAEVEDALRVAVDRQVVEPRPGPAYAFRHPLFREVLEASLLPGECRRLHGAAASVLEARAVTDADEAFALTGQIAWHWQSAEVADRGFRAAVRAGLAAEEVFAFAEADELLQRAIAQLPTLQSDAFGDLPVDHCDLLAQASQAAHLVGDGTRAVDLAKQAVELCAEPVRRSRSLERLGTYCFNAGLAEEADAAFRSALELLPADASTAARARVLAGLALLAMGWTRMDEARTWCGQAIEAARAAGARREEGRALDALGVVTVYDGDFDTGIGYSQEALAIAQEVGEPDELAGAYIDLAHVLGLAGRHDEAVAVCAAGYEQMHRVGLARQDGSFLQANAIESLVKSGRWAAAGELLDTALGQRSRGMRAFPILAQGARLALGQGRLVDAAALIDRVRELADDYGLPDAWRRETYEIIAELALEQHRPGDALDAAEAGLDLVAGGDEQRFAGPLIALAERAAADLAEQARTSRDTDLLAVAKARGDTALDRARSFDPDPLVPDQHPLPETGALAASTAAEVLRAGGDARGVASADAWAGAADAWQQLGRPLPEAYARWREGEALVLAKHPGGRPVAALRAAWTLAHDLGADGLLADIERMASWGRIDLVRAVDESDPVTAPAASTGVGLTSREHEVLGALAAGRTNREIAESLFISTKTVSVHVSNILRKLEVEGREEAARAAYRLGLVPGTPVVR